MGDGLFWLNYCSTGSGAETCPLIIAQQLPELASLVGLRCKKTYRRCHLHPSARVQGRWGRRAAEEKVFV